MGLVISSIFVFKAQNSPSHYHGKKILTQLENKINTEIVS